MAHNIEQHAKHNIRKRFSFAVLVVTAVVIFAGLGMTLKVFAEGSSGTGDGATGGSCASDKNATVYWDTCYGATWRRYPADSDSITISDAGNVKGGTIKNCKTNGGYYYRLALEVYSPKAFYSSGVIAASLGRQAGLARVNQMRNFGSGYYNFIEGIPGTENWATVKGNFEKALAAGITGFSTDWDTTAWFCWDTDLENPKTQFQSKSRASSNGETNSSLSWDTDAPDLEVQADDEGKATVVFAHQLRYEAGTPSGTYDNAATDWKITTDTVTGVKTGRFETPGGAFADTAWFPTGTEEIKVEVELGENETEKKICSTISYTTKNVQWDGSTPHKMTGNADTGSTKACAIIKQTSTPTQNTGGVLFWPQSSVESVAEKDVVNHKEWTTDDKNKADGDKVTIQLSTDYDTAKANFEHKMHFEVDLGSYTFGENDTWQSENMCTEYWVDYADGTQSQKTKYCPTAPSSGSSTSSGETSVPGKQNHVVNVPGKAIEKINYEKKTIPIKRKEDKSGPCGTIPETNTCSWNPKRWIYYSDSGAGSGKGNSSAEIEYVSPNEPDDSNGPSSDGDVNGSPMYAGERSGMTWWAQAEAINTRRIMEYQSIVFQVQWYYGYDANKVSGDISKGLKYSDNPGRSQYDPCGYWRSYQRLPLRANTVDCTQVSPSDFTLNDSFPVNGYTGIHTVNSERRVLVIPDYVGDKYCNSFGYKWQYFWGVKRISTGSQWEWKPDNQTYWTHYDAACRVIAKKPSVAIWNGGIFTPSSIDTSLASRYNNTVIGTLAASIPNASFGSWTEHLGVANGGIVNFGSGASLAFGSNFIGVSTLSNSPLTIRNDIALGSAGITPNPTLATRLASYLGDLAGTTDVYTGTTVNISSPVTTSGSYDDVYQLPQKVIYAPDATTINISKSVTEIDAWIIAPNATINTCVDFQASNNAPGGTETLPNSANDPCDTSLQINGPVIAKNLKLNRTGGADNIYGGWDKYTPAEIFNLSADTYLWAYGQAGRYGSSYTEAYSRELPPRY